MSLSMARWRLSSDSEGGDDRVEGIGMMGAVGVVSMVGMVGMNEINGMNKFGAAWQHSAHGLHRQRQRQAHHHRIFAGACRAAGPA